jgi:hypothetical protein
MQELVQLLLLSWLSFVLAFAAISRHVLRVEHMQQSH